MTGHGCAVLLSLLAPPLRESTVTIEAKRGSHLEEIDAVRKEYKETRRTNLHRNMSEVEIDRVRNQNAIKSDTSRRYEMESGRGLVVVRSVIHDRGRRKEGLTVSRVGGQRIEEHDDKE
ncbi:hypothetical protein BDQ17DRAFT_1405417 [Cyathus striatus]|nr:hypothetical protein BDQ17DRAFT_1405417 [Cyathus striatus]